MSSYLYVYTWQFYFQILNLKKVATYALQAMR